MLRASLTFAGILSVVIVMQPIRGPQRLQAQQAPSTTSGQVPSTGSGQAGGGGQRGGGPIGSIGDRTAGMQKMDGYFPMYWDERTGSLFLEIGRFDADFLYNTGLAAGLGSNDIGLDRGAGGGARLVFFQ